MSAASVRAAVADYLTTANLPNMVEVFAEPPFDMQDVPWDTLTPAGSTTAAVGIVFIDDDDDEVIGLDGAGGQRKVAYSLSFEAMVWDVSANAVTGQAAFDALVAAVKVRLRSDPQFGTAATPGVAGNDGIIQGAFSRLQGEYGRPVRLGDGDAWACWMGIHFAVETFEYST